MKSSPLSIGFLGVALAMLPMSAASAHDFHHHHFGLVGGVFGLAGAVVVGAVTIATAPLVILGDALSGGHRGRYDRDGYDGRGPAYGYEGPDGYGGSRGAYAREPEYRYPPRRAFSNDGYSPSPGYYRGRAQSYPPEEAYNTPRRGYYPDAPDQYDPRQGDRSPQSYYRGGRDYGPEEGDERSGDNYSRPPEQYRDGQDYGPSENSYPPDDGYAPRDRN